MLTVRSVAVRCDGFYSHSTESRTQEDLGVYSKTLVHYMKEWDRSIGDALIATLGAFVRTEPNLLHVHALLNE
jgi:hypothetical protein